MSGRCKSCDSILEEWEMKAIDPLTGTYTELCDCCISDDDSSIDYPEINVDSIHYEELL